MNINSLEVLRVASFASYRMNLCVTGRPSGIGQFTSSAAAGVVSGASPPAARRPDVPRGFGSPPARGPPRIGLSAVRTVAVHSESAVQEREPLMPVHQTSERLDRSSRERSGLRRAEEIESQSRLDLRDLVDQPRLHGIGRSPLRECRWCASFANCWISSLRDLHNSQFWQEA